MLYTDHYILPIKTNNNNVFKLFNVLLYSLVNYHMLCGYTVYVLEKLANKQTQDRRIIHLAALKCGVKPNPSVYEMNKQFFIVTVLELSCQGKHASRLQRTSY